EARGLEGTRELTARVDQFDRDRAAFDQIVEADVFTILRGQLDVRKVVAVPARLAGDHDGREYDAPDDERAGPTLLDPHGCPHCQEPIWAAQDCPPSAGRRRRRRSRLPEAGGAACAGA